MASKLKESTTNASNIEVLLKSCEVNETLRTISPRWKMQVLHSIKHGVRQFSRLKEAFPSLSDQVLGKRLSELVAEKLVYKIAGGCTINCVTSVKHLDNISYGNTRRI